MEMVELVEVFIRERLPEHDEKVGMINRIVDCIIADREIRKVEDIVSRFNVSRRTLQRMFVRYVGVSPKWMVWRYRLQQAADRLADGEAVSWPEMALDLGYFDQAHFIKGFKALVGVPLAEYVKNVGSHLTASLKAGETEAPATPIRARPDPPFA